MEALEQFVIEHNDVVPSMNSPKSGYKSGHWAIGHKLKKQWEGIIIMRLLQAGMPKNAYDHVEVSAILTFPRAARRDADNYRLMLSKACGDALVVGNFIPDDTPDHYRFSEITFDKGPKKTMLTLDARRTSGP